MSRFGYSTKEAEQQHDRLVFQAGRIEERRRPRKRGFAVDARPYNHHIAVRMTYYESEIFSAIMLLFDPELLDIGISEPGFVPEHIDQKARRAYGRLCRKAQACDQARKNRS